MKGGKREGIEREPKADGRGGGVNLNPVWSFSGEVFVYKL